MKIEIKNRWNGEVILASDSVSVKAAVELAVSTCANLRAANLRGADLSDANLRGADLRDANLRAANLRDADLSGANLSDANLRGADLRGADLRDANLRDADLSGANLSDANLRGADLSGANLSDANLSAANLRDAKNASNWIMPDGIKFSKYLSDVVPALLTAGGKTLKEVLDTGCWKCHSWDNCPMHAAFGIDRVEKAPPLLISRVKEFVQFFDQGLIPEPTV